MSSNRVILAALTASIGLGIAVVATAANGEQPLTRTAALSAAAERSPAFARAQRASDVFTSRSSDPANRAAALDIAQTSRRVFADDRGEAFVFLNKDNEVCLEWRPLAADVAGSDCEPVDSPHLPGVLMGLDGTMNNPVLAEMVEPGVSSIAVTQADGTVIDVPVTDGAFVYQGRSPFVVHSGTADGKQQSRRVAPVGPPE